MQPAWSLTDVLGELHNDIQQRLAASRKVFAHPDAKGDATEGLWLELLQTYLPHRYQADRAFVVDSTGIFSEQIDVLVFDRQYTPFIFHYQGQKIVPAEGVYAVFEAKQTINKGLVEYAQKKVASVRALHRTSLPIPHAGGTYKARDLTPILGGVLSLESDWTPPLGQALQSVLTAGTGSHQLDLGCVAAHGTFAGAGAGCNVAPSTHAATAFLFEFIRRLQELGTVAMIDPSAYGRWLP